MGEHVLWEQHHTGLWMRTYFPCHCNLYLNRSDGYAGNDLSYSIANGEYIYGLGTCHSFPMNAAHHWGLNCERVGKDRMGDVVNALKDGKMVVEICEAIPLPEAAVGISLYLQE